MTISLIALFVVWPGIVTFPAFFISGATRQIMANTIEIITKQSGQGNAISTTVKELGGLDKAASNSVGVLGRFGSALGSMGTIAGGIIAANLFGKLFDGISSIVSVGLDAVGSNQQLETSLKSLLTANLMYTESTETVTSAITKQIMSQDDYGFKVEELTAKLNTQKATYQEQIERIRQLTEQYGENGLDVIENKARHEQLAIAIRATEREIAGLTTSETIYTTATKKSWQQTMSQAEAFKLAKTQTADLLDFVSKLAVVSPFETETVEETTKYAIAAGMGLEATKEFVPAFLDLAASVGITSESLGFAADQLFQVKKIGKLTEVDLRQLRRIGIDLSKVIGVEMGMSVEEFNAQAEKSPEIFDELFAAVTRFSQNTFAGTSKEMATSVKGLKSTINDIFVIGSRTFMRPFVDALTPAIAGIISKLSDFVLGGDLQEIGQQFAGTLMGGFDAVSTVVSKIMRAFDNFGIRGAAVSIVSQLGLDHATIMPAVDAVLKVIGKIQRAFNNFGIKGAAVSILGQLGMDPAVIGQIDTTIRQVIDSVTVFVDKVMGAYERFGVKGATVSILGQLGMDPAMIGTIFTTIYQVRDAITGFVDNVIVAFDRFGAKGAAMSILGQLGLTSDQIVMLFEAATMVQEAITSIANSIITNWPIMQAVALTTWEILKGIFAGFQNVALIAGPQLQQAFSQITGALNSMGISWTDVWNALKQATGIVLAGIGALLLGVVAVIGGLVTATTSAISAMVSVWMAMGEQIRVIIEGLGTQFAGASMIWSGIINGEWSLIWQGLVTTVQGVFTTLKGLVGTLVMLFVGPFAIIASTVQGFITGVIAMFTGLYDTLVGNSIIPDLVNGIVQWFQQLPQKIVTALSGLVDMVTKPFEAVMDTASEIFNPEKWEDIGIGIIEGVVAGIESAKDQVLEVLKAMAADALSGVKASLGMNSPSTEFRYVGQMMAAGVALGWEDKKGDIFSQVLGMGDIGHMMGRGMSRTKAEEIKKGFKGALVTLWDEIVAGTKGAFDLEALTKQGAGPWAQFVKDADIKFADVVATIKAGGAEIAEEMRTAITAQAMAMGQGFATFGEFLVGMLEQQRKPTQDIIDSISKLTAESDKLAEKSGKLSGEIVTQEQKLGILNQELASLLAQENQDTIAIEKKQMAIAELTKEIDKNRLALKENQAAVKDNQKQSNEQLRALRKEARTSRSATIELLQQFMAGDEQLFKYTLKSDLTNTNQEMMDRNRAQEKLNQLLEEERKEQEKIAALEKARADLAFLQQQMSIIQLIKDSGLNVGDILGGITLGLGASIPDLLAVTSNLVAAMVGQINDDLQIASPSKLLFNTFKTNVGGAIAGGLMAAKGMVQGAVTPLVEPLLSIPDRANQSMRQTNNYFNQTVNTRADQSSVIGDFRVMQMMIGD